MSSAARSSRATEGHVLSYLLICCLFSFQSFSRVPKPAGENVPWPLPRTFHPLCALVDPDSVWSEGEDDVKQSIFLLWGRDTKETVAEQAGFFTFDKKLKEVSWREVRCSRRYSNLEPRCTNVHVWEQ